MMTVWYLICLSELNLLRSATLTIAYEGISKGLLLLEDNGFHAVEQLCHTFIL